MCTCASMCVCIYCCGCLFTQHMCVSSCSIRLSHTSSPLLTPGQDVWWNTRQTRVCHAKYRPLLKDQIHPYVERKCQTVRESVPMCLSVCDLFLTALCFSPPLVNTSLSLPVVLYMCVCVHVGLKLATLKSQSSSSISSVLLCHIICPLYPVLCVPYVCV